MPSNEMLPLPPIRDLRELPYVYVVNSDPDFLEMIGDLLEDTHVQVTLEQLRPNPEVTLNNLRSARPDVLLLDVVPFQENASLLLDLLARDTDLHELPVILASTTPSIVEQLANTHADLVRDILPKPFELETFYLLLSRVVVGLRV